MEKLRLLETRVEAMLEKTRLLEEENERLRREVGGRVEELQREANDLRAELNRERAGKQDVVTRIDSLLAKLQDEPS